MKYFNSLLIIVAFVFFWAQSAVAASVDYTSLSPNPKIGEQVAFAYVPDASPNNITWDFGDGSAVETTGATLTNNHTYQKSGTYTVKVWDPIYLPGGVATVQVTVGEPKITHEPKRPRAGQKITFTAENFSSDSCIKWWFGDKRHVKDRNPPDIIHSYAEDGRYKVQAFDDCSNVDPVVKTITIGSDTRKATYTPRNPKANQRITFRTRGNYSGCIKWDFGDGVRRPGSSIITHSYRKAGTYTVKIYGYCGDDDAPQILQVVVVSGFAISRLELQYKDATPGAGRDGEQRFKGLVPIVDKNTRNFRATARIKYTGTGIITMQWLVDNKVMQMKTMPARFSGRLVIDTGVDLPTHTPGPHTVTVRFLSPKEVDFKIPVIRYMVSPSRPKIQQEAEDNFSIILKILTNEQGQLFPVQKAPLSLVPGEYGIFDGVIENNSKDDLQNGRLNIYLAGSLVDSQLLLNVPAGDRKTFKVSMKMVEQEGTAEFIIVDQAGKTIASQRLMVQPAVSP